MEALAATGWIIIPDILSSADAVGLVQACEEAIATLGNDVRSGDKPSSGTRRLCDLLDRVPAAAAVAADERLLAPVRRLLGLRVALGAVTYRSPRPGFGEQRLHADDRPKLTPGPDRIATVIVALTDFTVDNGATRIVPGSHRRPDLQRRSGSLDRHPDELLLQGPAGTAFVFSGHLLHSGTRNRSREPRPALQLSLGQAGPDYVGA